MRLHQTEKFLHSEGNHHQMKRQPTEMEKLFASHIFNKGLMAKIYEELKELYNIKKIHKQINKLERI